MPFSRWIIAVAFGLIYTGSPQAQQEAQRANQNATEQSKVSNSDAFGVPVRIIENDEAAQSRQRSEEEARQREIKDLIAQQRMAIATEAMNEATQSMKRAAWWSVAIVGLGTGLLVWTLCLTRQANRAAQNAVEVTRDIGEAQVRAYIGFDIASGNVVAGKRLLFQIKIENHGASPAYNISVASAAVVRNRDWKWGDDDITSERPSGTYLHPKGSQTVDVHTNPTTALTEQQIYDLKDDTKCIFGSVTVYFYDVFMKSSAPPRRAQLRFEFSGQRCFESDAPSIAREGNFST